MVTGGNAQAGVEVVEDSEGGGLEAERRQIGTDATHQRDEDDEIGIQPVDVFVPVAPCYGIFGDVRLL